MTAPPRSWIRTLLTALVLGGGAQAASATLINLDLGSRMLGLPLDGYATGAGVFGDEHARWNTLFLNGGGAQNSATSFVQSLSDSSGAASGVTLHIGGPISIPTLPTPGLSGRYAKLGGSSMKASGFVTFAGLATDRLYDLVVYGGPVPASFIPSGEADAERLLPVKDWSTLSEGSHYVLFEGMKPHEGRLSFSGNHWTALQLRAYLPPEPPAPPAPPILPPAPDLADPVTAVPEPSSAILLLLGGAALLAGRRLRRPGVGC